LKYQEPLALLTITGIFIVMSGLHPYDRTTWLLEVFPILIAAPILIATYRRFPFTPLLYRLMFLHALILIIGAYYTYARVPVGDWARHLFDLSRNHFDRVGHFAQGFVPAMIAREILLRKSPLRPGKWLFFLVVCVCLSISACYEFIEWWAAVLMGESATDFLGTQGDPWDTQWDMFLAFIGAIVGQITLSRYHDQELGRHGMMGGRMEAVSSKSF
jgi:putative membrane protein